MINDHIKHINKDLAPFEQLKRVAILDKEWSIDGGELTPKMSLKRRVIKEKFKQEIDHIFSVESI